MKITAEADQGVALALERGQQAEDLLGLTAGRERDHHVAGHEDADVAMDRLCGMKKEGRGAGRGERGSDLLRDDAALAHSGHHDAAIAFSAVED